VTAGDAAWNAALAGWFFRGEFAGRPVFLCVDEETLEVVGRESGIAASYALRSLTAAVQPRVRCTAPLDSWVRDAAMWRRSGFTGPPPFVSVLAVTVLAATLAGRPNDRSYYPQLNELLGLPGHGMPRYFDSDVQQLWSCLNEWLDDVQHGMLGIATATNEFSAFTNVGWALSQTVLRPSDRAKLPFLFTALGVYPGQQVDGHVLLTGLRHSAMAGRGTSRRLTQVLDNPALTGRLAEALASELARWDGTLRDESGRRAAELLLTFHERSRTFGVAVRAPADLARLGLRLGTSPPVTLGEPGELQLLPIAVTASLLDGASLPAEPVDQDAEGCGEGGDRKPIRLIMPHTDVHLLAPNDGLARWADVRTAEIHRRHLVLVRADIERASVVLMSSLGKGPPHKTSILCPSGWVCYQFVPVRTGQVSGPLALLSPRGGQVSTLDGGLPISARSRLYLSAGPPDLLLDLATPAALTIDGQAVSDVSTSGRFRLADRGLAAGEHRVHAGGTRLTVRLVDEYATGPADCSLAIRLRAETSPAGQPRMVPAWTGVLDSTAGSISPADAVVRGACVELPQSRQDYRPGGIYRPQARAGGRHYALSSDRVAVRVFPSAPVWLLRLRPQPVPHMTDLSQCGAALPFAPVWFLRIARDQVSVVRGCAPPSGQQPEADAIPTASNEWQEIMPCLRTAVAPPGQSAEWAAWLYAVDHARRPGEGGDTA
jgi:hypothetical protein